MRKAKDTKRWVRRRSRNAALISIAAALLAAFAGGAQARHRHASHEGVAGQFDYYILSLSWAPTYCLTHAEDGSECSGKGYGFVLHGLWPQYDAGGYPETCSSSFYVSGEAIAKGRTVYPSERLMQHEWREHGTCSGLDALSYFDTADKATAVIRMPAAFEAPRTDQNLTAEQVTTLIQGANPRVPAGALTVACSRADLSEVRVCLTKDLMPRACGRGIRTSCPGAPLRIPASRP
jgi:ribonuclease T2